MPNASAELPVLVVGGGVAGMRAALCLADAGKPVFLAEKDGFLGGQVLRLDKVYPTDHCAFCPVWPFARACREHPRIRVLLHTTFMDLEERDGARIALLRASLPSVDADSCIFCGLCKAACPKKAILDHPADLPWDPAAPPSVSLDAALCDGCGACVQVCPVNAIDLSRLHAAASEELRLPVADCIFAGGFYEPRPAPAPEFGGHSHPDILTAMAFEAWTAEFRSGSGALRCLSDQRPARRIAFIQCAGARDRRYLAHCSAVCCMHAAKQARWMKRRNPDLEISIFYTDLRAPGKGQEHYMRRAADEGIRMLRRRPGLVAPLDPAREKGILIRHEQDDTVCSTIVDIVVLNGGLASCPASSSASCAGLPVHAEGVRPPLSCGFCREPADIAQSVIQGAGAASRILASEAASRAPSSTAASGVLIGGKEARHA